MDALLLEANNHNMANREAMYVFFAKHVLGDMDAKQHRERSVCVEKLQDMLALHNRKLPYNALSFAGRVRRNGCGSRKRKPAASANA